MFIERDHRLASPKRNRSPEERVPVLEDQVGIPRDWSHRLCWNTAFPCGDRAFAEEYGRKGVVSKRGESVSTKYSGIMLIMVLVLNDHLEEQVKLQASAVGGAE